MAYTFVEIEERKGLLVWVIFLALIVIYFLLIQLVWLFLKVLPGLAEMRIAIDPMEMTIVFIAALLIASFHWVLVSHNMIRRVRNLLGAIDPDPNDSFHQVLRNVVEEVSVASGGKRIEPFVIPTPALNACAMTDINGNSAIGVTEGLLARLTRSQLEGVVAHEAAHIAMNDSFTTTITSSLFGICSSILEKIGRIMRFSLFSFLIIAAIFVLQFLSYLLYIFLSRSKEYRADAVAVRLSRNPIALAEALYIISHGWRGRGVIPEALGPVFIVTPKHSAIDESEGLVADMFSTHPPAGKRIGSLLAMAHSDIGSISKSVEFKPPEEFDDSALPKVGDSRKIWSIFRSGEWIGPLDIPGLILSGLTPDSWIIRNGVNKASLASDFEDLTRAIRGASPRGGSSIACSKCKQPLTEVRYEGALARKCEFCGGILLDTNIGFRLLVRKGYSFSPEIERMALLAQKSYIEEGLKYKSMPKLECPQCGKLMRHNLFSYGYPIESDSCESCKLLWFDRSKFEALQCLYEKIA